MTMITVYAKMVAVMLSVVGRTTKRRRRRVIKFLQEFLSLSLALFTFSPFYSQSNCPSNELIDYSPLLFFTAAIVSVSLEEEEIIILD